MKAPIAVLATLLSVSCTTAEAPVEAGGEVVSDGTVDSPHDDGTYLARIDPLGGNWRVMSIGDLQAGAYESWVNFAEGGFLNHGGRCGGGAPAFYQIDGEKIVFSRFETPQYGKCEEPNGVAFDRALTALIDRATIWQKPNAETLVLTAADGTRAVLTKPPVLRPDINGRWQMVSIGGEPFPATMTIGNDWMSAHADCNSISFDFAVPEPGKIVVKDWIQTSMGCGKEREARDKKLARSVSAATSYSIDDEQRLVFGGPQSIILRRPAPADTSLAGDYEHCGNTTLGAYHAGPVTMRIASDTMTDNAGCTARYIADGPELSLTLGDEAACKQTAPPYRPREPIEIGGEYSPLALATPDGWAFTEDGVLKLRTPRGSLNLCRKGAPRPFGSG